MKISGLVILFFSFLTINAQTDVKAFKKGEWLKFRVSYSNFLNAGNATVEVKEASNNGKKAFHVVGNGKTTGVISWFFKVKNDYQTYFYEETLQPYRFIRKMYEGGYTKDKEILFDHQQKKALVKNFKHGTEQVYDINNDVQDLVSVVYYLRNQDLSKMKPGDDVTVTMFFDQSNYKFKLQLLGREVIRTKFGKVAAMKLRPIVQAGRVFKAEESLTVWVSDDKNKVPLRIKASLVVGSLRADLNAFKGLANPFPLIFN